jgi:hypothetical protein
MVYRNPDDKVVELRADPDATPKPKPEGPRPLMRELPPAKPFPVDALGDLLGDAAKAIHDRVQAPLAIGAQSVLASATLAVQGHVDVVLPIGDGVVKPVSGYFMTIAVSGERKSASDDQAMRSVEQYENDLRKAYDSKLPDYLNDKAGWESARANAVKKHKGDRAKIKAALDVIGPAPTAPWDPLLTCPEPTYEGLWKLFATGCPSLGLFSTEGGQFIGGFGMSAENRLKTCAGLSDIWDGKPLKRVRSGDGAGVLPNRRLALHLMAQPMVADLVLGDALLAEQGILSRKLIVAPDTAIGERTSREEQPSTAVALKEYSDRLLAILKKPLPLADGTTNQLQPRAVRPTKEAKACLIRFADHVEHAMRPGGELETVRGLANKAMEHAARIAAVFSALVDIERTDIKLKSVKASIEVMEHYIDERVRLSQAAQINGDLRLAEKLRAWLYSRWLEDKVSLPDIYQRGINAIGDQATARKVVALLEGHGWLERIQGGDAVAGVIRRDAWRIVGKKGKDRCTADSPTC